MNFNLIHIIFLLHVFTNVDTCIVIYDIYMYIYGQMICMKYKGKIEEKKRKIEKYILKTASKMLYVVMYIL